MLYFSYKQNLFTSRGSNRTNYLQINSYQSPQIKVVLERTTVRDLYNFLYASKKILNVLHKPCKERKDE